MKTKWLHKIGAVFMASAIACAACAVHAEESTVYALDDLTELSWFTDCSGWFPVKWDLSEGTNFSLISSKTGVQFTDFNCPPEDAATKLGLLLASGKLPDFITITDEAIRKELIESGSVWELHELLETYLPESHLLQDFPDDTKEVLTYRDGGWYVFPSHYTSFDNREEQYIIKEEFNTMIGQNQTIIFNKELMEQAGITKEDVATESGFFAALEKVKGMQVDGGKVIPVMVHGSSYQVQTLNGLKYNFGVVPVDNEGNYISDYRNPGYKNVLRFLNKCITGGYLDVNLMTVDDTVLLSNMESGRVFCFIGNQSGILPKEGYEKFVSYGAVRSDDGSVPCVATWKEATCGWLQTMISKSCKNPEAAARFLDYMTSTEGLYQTQYGTEGIDYNIVDGFVIKTEEGLEKIDNGTETGIGNWWVFYNDSFGKSVTPAPAEDSLEYKATEVCGCFTYDPECYIYNTCVFDFPANVIEPNSDLGIAYAQLESYREGAIASIITAKSEEEFETRYQELLDTAIKLGVEEMDQEYDKVYKGLCERYEDSVQDPNASIHY